MSNTENNIILEIEARPNSREEKIEQKEGKIKIYVKAPAEKGKANIAIIKIFSKLGPCRIISGFTSKKKKILISASKEGLDNFLLSRKV
jgi:uncharacterized protein (TIGR00251 family)